MDQTTPPENDLDEEARKKALRARRRARIIEEAKQVALKAMQEQSARAPGSGGAGGRVVEHAPLATTARMRTRHWGLILSFLLLVVIPIGGSAWYLWDRAVDQYDSTVSFTVRQEKAGGASDFLTGFAAQVSGTGGADAAILYEFIQSQQLVVQVNETFDLEALYSVHVDQDPVFSLKKNPTLEELVAYWQRIVRVSFDEGSSLMEMRVLAFDPQTAQDIAREILVHSQAVVNSLNEQARRDTIRYSEAELLEAQERVRNARSALTVFRTRTQLVDPETDLAGRLGVVNTLQQQLAEALIAYDLLRLSTNDGDPRVQQAARRIDVIRARLVEERSNVANGEGSTASGEDYPTLLAEYESLLVDTQFAEESYRASLAAVDVARANAARQSRYLAAFIEPTLSQTPRYPQRQMLLGLIAMFLVLSWAILALVYYSVRDSR